MPPLERVVSEGNINALRALAPPPLRPVPRPSRPQPRTPPPRWSRRHSVEHVTHARADDPVQFASVIAHPVASDSARIAAENAGTPDGLP
jgi:hypothetical protein